MRSSALTKLALAALMALGLSAATSAHAGSGSFGTSSTSPTMYQTNWSYYGSVMTPPGSVPSTARVNYIGWSASFSWYPSGLTTYLCSTNSPCYQLGGASGGYSVGTQYYSATDQFQFGFRDNQSTTYTYSSKFLPNVISGTHSLTIGYVY